MTESKNFLPLGSIVVLAGGVKKLLIVSRGNILNDTYFDYGAILYPEGMIDDNMAYFNASDIIKIVHEGYTDEDNALIIETINRAYETYTSQETTEKQEIEEMIEADDPFASVRDMED